MTCEKMKCENDDFSFDDRDNLYRVFKNDEDKKKETINLKEGKCITLESLYNEFIKPPLEKEKKRYNTRNYFDKENKPVRDQSQIGYRLMNLILYSHLFTSVLFTNKKEKYLYNENIFR